MSVIGHLGRKRAPRAVAALCAVVHLTGIVAVAGAEAGAEIGTGQAGLVRPAVPVSAGAAVLADVEEPRPDDAVTAAPVTEPAEPPAPPQPAPPATVATTTTTTTTTTTAPAPVDPPVIAEPAPSSPLARVEHTYRSSVPSAWRSAIPARFSIIPGSTSWASADGHIEISRFHAEGSAAHLAVIVTHEFGHLVAFRHGTGAYAGAAPAGWPPATSNPAEHWADCVQQVFTGRVSPSPGLPPCRGEQLAFADRYLAAGPTR